MNGGVNPPSRRPISQFLLTFLDVFLLRYVNEGSVIQNVSWGQLLSRYHRSEIHWCGERGMIHALMLITCFQDILFSYFYILIYYIYDVQKAKITWRAL